MTDEYYRSEISYLNDEIYRLNKKLDAERKKETPDKMNPFDNPTDYPDFSGDYSDIMPELDAPECVIPLEPDPPECRRLKRFYSVGGWCLLGQFFISEILSYGMVYLIKTIIENLNKGTDRYAISTYMRGSSILMGVTMLTFVITNILFAFVGMKMTNTPKNQLVRTRDFSFGKAVQYCIIAFFLFEFSMICEIGIEDIFSHYGSTTVVTDTEGLAVTGTGTAITLIYTCIIAPMTEELFFRGMLLRVFSRANQRFAVFATAFFFGLSHHNIPQFVLAFVVGIFLANITLKHNSIIPAVIVHMFVNISSIAVQLLEENSGYIFSSLVQLVIAIMGFFLLCIFMEQDRVPYTVPAQARRGLSVAKYSVMFDIAVISQLIYSIYLILI